MKVKYLIELLPFFTLGVLVGMFFIEWRESLC